MSITLTLTDLARCEAVNRAMLSPLAAPSIADWKSEVSRTLRELLQAEISLFGLPGDSTYFYHYGLDDRSVSECERFLLPALQFRTSSFDPYIDTFMSMRRQQGIEVFGFETVQQLVGADLERAGFYNEVLKPGGLTRFYALNFETTLGSVLVATSYTDQQVPRFGEHTVTLLRALLPALKAGVETYQRARNYRFTLDGVKEPIIVFDSSGREIHRNESFERIYKADPERERLLNEINLLVRQIHPMAAPSGPAAGTTSLRSGSRTFSTTGAAYELTASLLSVGAAMFEPGIMISVSAGSARALPQPEEIRTRYSLTKREAEIALLLAEGLSNDDIAGKLFLSPHTAKRHTENIFGKMGLNTRKALALKLIQGAVA